MVEKVVQRFTGFLRDRARRRNLRRLGRFVLPANSRFLASVCFGPFVDPETNVFEVGGGSLVRGLVTFSRSGARFVIGNNTSINGGTNISIAEGLEIGSNVLISYDCMIMDHNGHSLDPNIRKRDLPDLLEERPKDWSSVKMSPIRIEDSAWIGARCIVLKGVTIGYGAIVAAGSVVSKNVSPYTVVAGNPAREVGRVSRGEA